MRTVDIYIDTSIRGPRRGDGGCMYILAFTAGNGVTADAGGRVGRTDTTENQLALLGLEAALKRLREPCRLVLHLECGYLAAALDNRWYEAWKYSAWMNAKNRPVRDAETWRSVECLLNAHDFRVVLRQPHPYREWMRTELSGGSWRMTG